MKKLEVAHLSSVNKNSAMTEVLKAFAGIKEHKIDRIPWAAYPYKPKVEFKIAYCSNCILLQYAVVEKEMRITYQQSNTAVYEDSCVEFFISFEGREYYNFEFNPIGTCLAAFGQNREKRTFLPATSIEMIKCHTSLYAIGAADQKNITWELTLLIPFEVFSFHKPSSLKAISCHGNFYKCGDRLNHQHYLAWNPVSSPQPDFHLQEFFGIIKFI